MRFIACFRNPVEHAYSWNMAWESKEDLSFAEAIVAKEERFAAYQWSLDDRGLMLYGYFKGGCYASSVVPLGHSPARDARDGTGDPCGAGRWDREQILENFSLAEVARQYQTLYAKVIR